VRFAQADRMTIQSFGWASHWHDGHALSMTGEISLQLRNELAETI
jgi:hypothetical protein